MVHPKRAELRLTAALWWVTRAMAGSASQRTRSSAEKCLHTSRHAWVYIDLGRDSVRLEHLEGHLHMHVGSGAMHSVLFRRMQITSRASSYSQRTAATLKVAKAARRNARYSRHSVELPGCAARTDLQRRATSSGSAMERTCQHRSLKGSPFASNTGKGAGRRM